MQARRQNHKPNLPAVILNRPKYPYNLAAAIRACSCFDVDTLIWTGSRFTFEDGERLPREERIKGYSAVDFFESEYPFDLFKDATPVCVELTPNAEPLTQFVHPEQAIYVFGPEDGHVTQAFRGLCHRFVYIPSRHCLNLASAVNVVLAHRMIQRQQNGLVPICDVGSMLNEERGVAEIGIGGWDGAHSVK
jgi:tRNA(Leu) C34 or U34 (ribose-2'-O)-methylase TrmL